MGAGAGTTENLVVIAVITAVRTSGVILTSVKVKLSLVDKVLMEVLVRGLYGFLGCRRMKLSSVITDVSLEGGEESDGNINANVDFRTTKFQIELLLMMMTEFQSKLKVDTVFELTVQT